MTVAAALPTNCLAFYRSRHLVTRPHQCIILRPQLSTAIHSYPQLSAVTWPSGLCLNYGRYEGYAGYAGYPSPPLVRGR